MTAPDPQSGIALEAANAEATRAIGRAIGGQLRPGDLVTLDGPLGAGKTTLVRGLALGAGSHDDVSSPTFVLSQEYEIEGRPGLDALVHIDAYRLSPGELPSIGWEGDAAELRRGALVVVEWASRIAEALPDDRLAVALEHADPGRRMTLQARGGLRERLPALQNTLAPWVAT
ncbi:MAG: tRNA (adenosine(37)-N6)-threonylcarbamoyltransferase complex ATPase subunit type 1 TsaE [Planctomycetota bacterium]